MQLTGWHNGNEMRNAICVETQTSFEWPYCMYIPFPVAMSMSCKDTSVTPIAVNSLIQRFDVVSADSFSFNCGKPTILMLH